MRLRKGAIRHERELLRDVMMLSGKEIAIHVTPHEYSELEVLEE